mmetsp:Transcript_133042/g.315331  ORF Transcript_133042/g.315331 Transcript_133042/m.315331 type:complete len:218 (-) Transcript_133042:1334-1987(-)
MGQGTVPSWQASVFHQRHQFIGTRALVQPFSRDGLVQQVEAEADLLGGRASALARAGARIGPSALVYALHGLPVRECRAADHLAKVMEVHRSLTIAAASTNHVLHLVIREAYGGDLPEGFLELRELNGVGLPGEVSEGTLQVTNCAHALCPEAGLICSQEVLKANLFVWEALQEQVRHIHVELAPELYARFLQITAVNAFVPIPVKELKGITQLLVA